MLCLSVYLSSMFIYCIYVIYLMVPLIKSGRFKYIQAWKLGGRARQEFLTVENLFGLKLQEKNEPICLCSVYKAHQKLQRIMKDPQKKMMTIFELSKGS